MSRVRIKWHSGGDSLPAQDMPLPTLNLLNEEEQRKAELTKASFLADIGQQLWRELFTKISTLEQLAVWEGKIPAFECNCKRFYLSWKANNQPVEVNGEIPFEWKWSLKSAVNQKLGHADLTLEEARQYWQSQLISLDHLTQQQRCKEGEPRFQAQ